MAGIQVHWNELPILVVHQGFDLWPTFVLLRLVFSVLDGVLHKYTTCFSMNQVHVEQVEPVNNYISLKLGNKSP